MGLAVGRRETLNEKTMHSRASAAAGAEGASQTDSAKALRPKAQEDGDGTARRSDSVGRGRGGALIPLSDNGYLR